MLDLKKMTYINENGLRVTDSLIIREEFGIRQHAKVMRTIENIIKSRTIYLESDYNSTPINPQTSVKCRVRHLINTNEAIFIKVDYQIDLGNGRFKTGQKYEITERGFYSLLNNIVMRTIRAIIEREDKMNKNPEFSDSEHNATSGVLIFNDIHTLFLQATYQMEVGNGATRKAKKYEITEEGFYLLLTYMKSSTKEGAEKIYYIRRKFIRAFFTLREELNKMLKAYKILAEQFLPIDERGGILC